MAGRTRNIILKFTGDDRDAKRAVASVREDLRRMSREDVKARIDLDTRVLERKIAKVEKDLAVLRTQDASPEVDLKTQKALRKLDRMNLQLDRLKLKRVEIDIDVKRGGIERAAAALGSIDRGGDKFFKGIGDFFRSIPVLGQMLGVLIDGFVELGNTIAQGVAKGVTALSQLVPQLAGLAGPIGAVAGGAVNLALSFGSMALLGGALVIALNAVLGALVALAGALVALVASAAAAVGGLLALGIALGAALIPALIVGIGVMTRFVAIMKARQARQQEMNQATQAAKTAEEAHTRALEQRKRAEQQLAEATVAGRKAATQAIHDERDAELGLANAKNGVEDARLQLALAKRDLKDFLKGANVKGGLNGLLSQATDVHADPGKLQSLLGDVTPGAGKKKIDPLDLRQKLQAVRDAQLGVQNATNGVTQAEERLADARSKEADFVNRGLRAYGPYRTALSQVDRANAAVAKSADEKTAAEAKYEKALRKLTPTEKTTLGNLDKFLAGFQKLAKAVSDPVFKALNEVFGSLSKSGIDFTGALSGIGKAFGDVIRAIGSFLTEPASREAFKVMAAGAADLVRELGAHAFVSFLRIMREVAVSALPAVQSAARSISGWLGRIAGQPKRIHGAVGTLVGQFRTWAGLASSVTRLVLALFRGAAPAGQSLVKSVTRIVDRWTAWLNTDAGQKRLRQFFRDAVQKTKDIVHWISNAVTWLREHLPSAAAKASSAFKFMKRVVDVFGAALKPVVKAVQTIGDVLGYIVFRVLPKFKLPKLNFPKLPSLPGIHLPGFLHRATGGPVPGVGSGDTQPAMLTPGEYVLRSGVVKALGIPFLNALNAGASPTAAMAGAGGRSGGGGDTHNYYVTVPSGGAPDPRSFIETVHRIVQTKG